MRPRRSPTAPTSWSKTTMAHLNHLRWRSELLRTSPDIAREYGMLKFALADKYGADRDGYTEAKTSFIVGALARAGISFVNDSR